MRDLEERHRNSIEAILGRPLTDAELQPAATPEALSPGQREVISVLAAAQRVLCVLFVEAIANVSVAGATAFIDRVTHVGIPSRTAPWGRGSEMGRWMFGLPQQRSVRSYVAFLSENLPPFASTRSIEIVTNGSTTRIANPQALPEEVDESALVRIALNLMILDSEGIESVVEDAAAIEVRANPDAHEILLTLIVDIDVYASVSWQHRDNEVLARLNAPRLVGFISGLKRDLNARLIATDGRLETTDAGFR